MNRGEAADAAIRELGVTTADRLIGEGLTRTKAFEAVAANFGVHPHTIRNWWRAAHPELALTGEDRLTLREVQAKLDAAQDVNRALMEMLERLGYTPAPHNVAPTPHTGA